MKLVGLALFDLFSVSLVDFFFCSFHWLKMEAGTNGEEPTSWEDLYNINLMPSELFLKFRKQIEGIRIGVNLEVPFCGFCSFYLFSILFEAKVFDDFILSCL